MNILLQETPVFIDVLVCKMLPYKKYHWLIGLNNRNAFFIVLEDGKCKIRCWQDWIHSEGFPLGW